MVTLPQYTLNGSSPVRYAEDFQKQLTAIQALRKAFASSDFPHGRDFQIGSFGNSPDYYKQARTEHRQRLDWLDTMETDITVLLEHACNDPRYS